MTRNSLPHLTEKELIESAIRGCMIMGMTREQAEQELRAAERRRYEDAEREWWNYDPSRG